MAVGPMLKEMPVSYNSRCNRRDLEEHWRKRLADAQERYRECSERFRAMRAVSGSWPSVDGNFAVIRAIREETAARTHYIQILRAFTELVVNDTIPEDPAD